MNQATSEDPMNELIKVSRERNASYVTAAQEQEYKVAGGSLTKITGKRKSDHETPSDHKFVPNKALQTMFHFFNGIMM